MRSARATAGLALLAAAAAALGACDDGAPPVRGFDSRQLLAVRDPTLRFYFGATKGVSYSTGSDAIGDAKRYWSIDVETGVITELASMFPAIGELPTTTTTPGSAARGPTATASTASSSPTPRPTSR